MSPDIQASVKARLLARAHERGDQFQLVLTQYVIERFLYRLGASAVRDRCVLKGAALLSVWMKNPYRATRDLDFQGHMVDDETVIRQTITEVCAIECPEDGLRFDLGSLTVESVRDEEAYPGRRVTLIAYLGKARVTLRVDVGFGNWVTVPNTVVEYPVLLDSLPAPHVLAYARETSMAEKFEAAVKLGNENSRMKDFHDIWALSGEHSFDARSLRDACVACFSGRRTPWAPDMPEALTSAFYEAGDLQQAWGRYRDRDTLAAKIPGQFSEIGERIISFLGPIRSSILAGATFEATWEPGGPWRSPASA